MARLRAAVGSIIELSNSFRYLTKAKEAGFEFGIHPGVSNWRRFFPTMSEAMVNIRQTFRSAADNEIVGKQTTQSLINLSKKMFYQDRIYENIMKLAVERSVISQKQSLLLETWLKNNKVNQKKEDAIGMLKEINISRDKFNEPLQVSFHLENTIFWDDALNSAGDI